MCWLFVRFVPASASAPDGSPPWPHVVEIVEQTITALNPCIVPYNRTSSLLVLATDFRVAQICRHTRLDRSLSAAPQLPDLGPLPQNTNDLQIGPGCRSSYWLGCLRLECRLRRQPFVAVQSAVLIYLWHWLFQLISTLCAKRSILDFSSENPVFSEHRIAICELTKAHS